MDNEFGVFGCFSGQCYYIGKENECLQKAKQINSLFEIGVRNVNY
jgi:hypothetical protein